MGYDPRLARTPTHVMCCICFDFNEPSNCFVDADGTKWDVCAKGNCARQAGLVPMTREEAIALLRKFAAHRKSCHCFICRRLTLDERAALATEGISR